jgi:hypothetical protein
MLKKQNQYSGNGKGKVHHVLCLIPILTLMLNKGYCLNIFYTIQGKAQAQAGRKMTAKSKGSTPYFPLCLTKQAFTQT